MATLGKRSDHEIACELTGREYDRFNDWTLVRAFVHSELSKRLQSTEKRGRVSASLVSESFLFTGDAARDNWLDLLHAYSLVSGQIEVRPTGRGMAEVVHNNMCLGHPWARLFGTEATIAYSLRPRSWWTRWRRLSFDSTIPVYGDSVVRCEGTLQSWTLQLLGVCFFFGASVRVATLPR